MENKKTITTYKQGLKDKILDAAMHDFAAHGIKAVRMDDIAQELGISKRTLYEIYENKEVMLYEGVKKFKAIRDERVVLMVSECSNVMDVLMRIYSLKVAEFKQVNPNFYSDIGKYPMVKRLLEEDRKNNHQRTLTFMKRGVSEGYFRKDVDYMLVIRMFDALNMYVMREEIYRQYSLEHILNNLFFVTLRGFCTTKGVEVLDDFLKAQ